MKKLISSLLVFAFFIINTSCLKPKHSVRVKNQYSRTLNVNIGSDAFGSIVPGNTTSYQNIPVGSSTLSGDLTGSISISGKGTHKWTLTITSAGTFTILEDK